MTRRLAPGALGLWLCASAVACSGDADSPTEIAIEVTSDLRPPMEIDRVDIDVTHLVQPQHASADLTKQDFPRHLTLVQDDGPLGPIRISVTGYLGPTKLVERIVEMSFSPRNRKSLSIRLERACLANFCDKDTTCVSGKCRAFVGVEPDGGTGGIGGSGTDGGVIGGGTGGHSGGNDAGKDSGTSDSGVIDSGPPPNRAPVCTISAPTANQTLNAGLPLQLKGACTDPENGVLPGPALAWSDSEGDLGNGATFDLDPLSKGDETFTLCARDPDDPAHAPSCAQVMVKVVMPDPPTVHITRYRQNLQGPPFVNTKAISFAGTAIGQQVELEWRDTFVGTFGTSSALDLTDPQIGVHTVTLIATDNVGQSAQDELVFTVLAPSTNSLVQAFSNVNDVVMGAVHVLAADSTGQVLAYGSEASAQLQRFDGNSPSAIPSAAIDGTALTDTINGVLIAENVNPKLIYIGTNNGLLVCTYPPGGQIVQTTCATFKDGDLPSNDVTALARASVNGSDYLLIGTADGLILADNPAGSNTCQDKDNDMECDGNWGGERIPAAAALGDLFWFASANTGLHSVDPQNGSKVSPNQGDSTNLSALVTGAASTLWAGSDGGIGHFDLGQDDWTLWNTTSGPSPGLAGNDVQALATAHVTITQKGHDVVWIGTSNGVSRFDPAVPSFMTLRMADGLPSNDVHAIVVLPNGDKVFGTNSGIVLYQDK